MLVTQPPGIATPTHIHTREAEAWFVLDGSVTYRAGAEFVTLGAGDFIYLPSGVPHAFRVTGSRPIRYLALAFPGNVLDIYREVGVPATERRLPDGGTPTRRRRRLATIGAGFGLQVVGPPIPDLPGSDRTGSDRTGRIARRTRRLSGQDVESDTDRKQRADREPGREASRGDDDRPAGAKRRYNSPRRAEQAAVTRSAVLASARELFVVKGYAATTVADIARHARVAVDTVYATVGRKPDLLREVLETSISGTDNAIPARQRDYVRRVSDATSATSQDRRVRRGPGPAAVQTGAGRPGPPGRRRDRPRVGGGVESDRRPPRPEHARLRRRPP